MTARRIMHVWLDRLATDRILRRVPSEPRDRPFATVEKVRGALVLRAVDANAEAHGLRPDMPLSEARALLPALRVEQADPDADHRALVAIARAADRYTPLVGLDPPDGLMLDVTGCAHLFGGEAPMLDDVLGRLAVWGFSAHGAVADNPALAHGLARHGPGGVHADRTHETFAALPVDALRLDEDAIAILVRLGLKTVPHVLSQPRAPLVQRFGPELARRLDQIAGRVSEPITPLAPVPAFLSERRFAEPVMAIEGIAACLPPLAARLSEALERCGEGARRLTLRLFHADGHVTDVTVGASEPLADPKRMVKLLTARLERVAERSATDSGIDLVRLYGIETGPLVTGQHTLDGASVSDADLSALVDTLCERLGLGAVTRLVPNDCHVPGREEAVRRACDAPACEPWLQPETSGPPDRPLTLFRNPEPVETIASVPDGPPIRFVWRRVFHTVAVAEGPERIVQPWWNDTAPRSTYDYFRVEDTEGRRFFMFREGLYGRETATPRWFVHGLFA